MEELLVSLACQLIAFKTDLKSVVQKTQKYTECHYNVNDVHYVNERYTVN